MACVSCGKETYLFGLSLGTDFDTICQECQKAALAKGIRIPPRQGYVPLKLAQRILIARAPNQRAILDAISNVMLRYKVTNCDRANALFLRCLITWVSFCRLSVAYARLRVTID